MLKSAAYFEQIRDLDKAVILYHRGGNVRRAMDLCFKNHNFEYLKNLAEDLGEEEDPETLAKAAEYFMANQLYDRAVHLFVSS
jgi:intraflagellar transport protein 140